MTAFVGTSGWDYPEWRGHFYPEGLPRGRFLEHYSNALTACELNATFYGRQTERSVARWASETPPDFVFCAKAHMRITHSKQMAPDRDARDFTQEFVSSLAELREKLAIILLQFPAFRERDDDALAEFVAALPAGPNRAPSASTSGSGSSTDEVRFRYAFEFRHNSWDTPEVAALLNDVGAGVCFADDCGDVPSALPTGPFAYVRLRAMNYTDEQKQSWSRLLGAEATDRDVFVFARHKGIDPVDRSAGIGLASWLAAQLGS